ncbi:DsbA family protein [Thalassococcus lentus]
MDDSKLPLIVGGGAGILAVVAAVSALTGDPKETATEAAEAVATKVEEVAEDVGDAVADAAETVVEKAEDAVEVAADAVEGAGEAVIEAVDETADEVAEVAEDAVDDAAEETVAEVADDAAVEVEADDAAAPLAALDLDNMTEEQSAAFDALVRDYLMRDPQVIMDAVAVLEQRQNQAQAEADRDLVTANLDALLDDGFSYVGGNPDGSFTIVEFLDYRCGYCRRAAPEVESLIEADGDIRLIVKEFPILGEASLVSSRFAIATLITEGPDAYKAMHDGLVALDGNPTEPALSRLASSLGLDVDAIFEEMESEEVARRIAETRALAQAMQISGTPSFVFGGTMLRGYAPIDAMTQIVAEERARP